jgi:hypothetical protein
MLASSKPLPPAKNGGELAGIPAVAPLTRPRDHIPRSQILPGSFAQIEGMFVNL